MKIFFNKKKNRFESKEKIPSSSFIFSKEDGVWYSTDLKEIEKYSEFLSPSDRRILLELLGKEEKDLDNNVGFRSGISENQNESKEKDTQEEILDPPLSEDVFEKIFDELFEDIDEDIDEDIAEATYLEVEYGTEKEEAEEESEYDFKSNLEEGKINSKYSLEERLKNLDMFFNSLSNKNKYGIEKFIRYVDSLSKEDIIDEKVYKKIKEEIEELIKNPDNSKSERALRKILMLPTRPLNLSKEKLHQITKNLDTNLFGYENLKDQIIGKLVYSLNNSHHGPYNILLIGEPGTGKSTIAKIIADSLDLKLNTINVANLSELDLPGSNRTWNNATEGLIARGLINNNDIKTAVFLLDEVDKAISRSNIINQISALIDPNVGFIDMFLGLEIDISHCIFILTANDKNLLPDYILDRCVTFEVKPLKDEDYKILLTKIAKNIISERLKVPISEVDSLAKRIVEDLSENKISVRKFQIVLNSLIDGFYGYGFKNNIKVERNLNDFYVYFLGNKNEILDQN
ncbi:AAA family ATPase [Hydrogenothermus marinus]|uniref:ATPase family protein associated with various cellular activities (AAA) n=1 Tax=Hydrogenothermus marinus TaxID=133270 RepID=A0A3M0BS10_9AQUI|nr:AAA family ATPase [Hydrogenothermus marinus]RMB00068.1 ATPase family protein associated with various cellular activities (AAA) [Hydrogenothermus marinus]